MAKFKKVKLSNGEEIDFPIIDENSFSKIKYTAKTRHIQNEEKRVEAILFMYLEDVCSEEQLDAIYEMNATDFEKAAQETLAVKK